MIEDDLEVSRAIASVLTGAGCAVSESAHANDALTRIHVVRPDVLVTDVRLPGIDGYTAVARAHALDPLLGVVVVTAHAAIDDAVHALRSGADYYLTKPIEPHALLDAVRSCIERRRRREHGARSATVGAPREMVGSGSAMRALYEQIARVAPAPSTVLLVGETGTGKERVAEALHAGSPRAAKPFVPVHCAALPEPLLESELFGHERGAFTGAHARHVGRFERADGGTLLLDEVGEMSLGTQAKLLRVLQEKRIERVGGGEAIPVDVRVIAATHRNLGAMVREGTFRADLFYRLDVVTLEIPPLRARGGDLHELVDHFLGRLAQAHGRRPPRIDPDAMRVLLAHDWPGNVRELEHVLERAIVLCHDDRITAADIAPRLAQRAHTAGAPMVPGATFAEVERYTILTTYESCGRNVTRTAEILGISPRTVHYRLREYRGERGRRRSPAERLASGAPGAPGVEAPVDVAPEVPGAKPTRWLH